MEKEKAVHEASPFLFYPQQVAHDSIRDEDALWGKFQCVFLDFQNPLLDMRFCHP